MRNKSIIVLLTIALLGIVLVLGYYAYRVNQVPSSTPIKKTLPEKTTSKTKTEKTDAQEIKDLMKTTEQKALEETECDEEEAQKYQEKIKTNKITTAQGEVSQVGDSFIKVDFTQGPEEWTSTVKINSDTTIEIPVSSQNPDKKTLTLSDLKPGDTVVVNSFQESIINNVDFVARSVFNLK